MLRDGELWASFANALSDTSEIGYGIEHARTYLENEPADVDGDFRKGVTRFLDEKEASAYLPIEWRVFVVSFCGRADRAAHWLHYGKAGTGYAGV